MGTDPVTSAIPEETDILDAAAQAVAHGLHLICNGRRTVISPIVPAGWFKIAVKLHPHNAKEPLPCAA